MCFGLYALGKVNLLHKNRLLMIIIFLYIVATGRERLPIEKRNIKEAMTYCPLLFLVFHVRNLYFLFILEMENSFALFAVLRKL